MLENNLSQLETQLSPNKFYPDKPALTYKY